MNIQGRESGEVAKGTDRKNETKTKMKIPTESVFNVNFKIYFIDFTIMTYTYTLTYMKRERDTRYYKKMHNNT